MNNKQLITFATISALLANFATAEDLVELSIEFPPPMITGTPVPAVLPHLEPPGTPAPTIMAPAGTKNLAAGKSVTSSDDFPIIGDLEYVTDGDKDAGEGYFVELFEDIQWVQIDLEKEAEIYAIAVWHFHSQKRAYKDVVVKVSNDESFEDYKIVFNSDHDNSAGFGKGDNSAYIETNEGKVIPVNKLKARYVRLYSNGNTSNEMNHYTEVEVYGI